MAKYTAVETQGDVPVEGFEGNCVAADGNSDELGVE